MISERTSGRGTTLTADISTVNISLLEEPVFLCTKPGHSAKHSQLFSNIVGIELTHILEAKCVRSDVHVKLSFLLAVTFTCIQLCRDSK